MGGVVMDAGAHEQPDHVVALLFQKPGRDGAVHATAHRQHDPRHREVPKRPFGNGTEVHYKDKKSERPGSHRTEALAYLDGELARRGP
jgi:hypothetical protein